MGRGALFLQRRSYRRRRLGDAARMLPWLGALLFLFPALWGVGANPSPRTASGGLYLFAVWTGLILAAVALSRTLGRDAARDMEREATFGTDTDPGFDTAPRVGPDPASDRGAAASAHPRPGPDRLAGTPPERPGATR